MSTDRTAGQRHFWWIDLLRFLAAFVVMAGHARGSFLAEYSVLPQEQHTPIVFGFYFLTRLGFESVMIFFVLSGFLVGGKAVERITEGTFRAKQYAIDRFARIMLPLVSVLLFYLPIALLCGYPVSPKVWIGNLLCVQGVLTGFVFGPLWSLSYEVWFYILMLGIALVWTAKRTWSLKTEVGLIILLISLMVFTKLEATLLFVWLLGAIAFVKFPQMEKRIATRCALVSAVLTALLIVVQQIFSGSHAIDVGNGSAQNPAVHNCVTLALGLSMAVFVRAVVDIIPKSRIAIKINAIGTRLAAFSYTLYLVHTPVFRLLTYLGAPRYPELSLTSVSLYVLWLGVAMGVAYALYFFFEKRTPLLKRWLNKLFGTN